MRTTCRCGTVRRPNFARSGGGVRITSTAAMRSDHDIPVPLQNRLGEQLQRSDDGDQNVAVPLRTSDPSARRTSQLSFTEATRCGHARRSPHRPASPVTRSSDGACELGKPYDFVGADFGIAGYSSTRRTSSMKSRPGCGKTEPRVRRSARRKLRRESRQKVFDLVNFVPRSPTCRLTRAVCPAASASSGTRRTTSSPTRTSDARTRAPRALTGNGNGVIGSWTSASMRQTRVLNPNEFRQATSTAARGRRSRGCRHPGQRGTIGLPDKDRYSAERAEGRYAVRQVRDQSDVAGASTPVQQGGERHPEAADTDREHRAVNLPRWIWSPRSDGFRRQPAEDGDAVGMMRLNTRSRPNRLPCRAPSVSLATISPTSRRPPSGDDVR